MTTTRPRPIIGRIGAKNRIAPWIIEHLQKYEWSTYCEPFCGSGAVFFRLMQEGIVEEIKERKQCPRFVLNDTDKNIINLFKFCRDSPEAIAHQIAFTPYSREEHFISQNSFLEVDNLLEQIRLYLVDGWQSHGNDVGRGGWSTGNQKAKKNGGQNNHPQEWANIRDRILIATDYLKLCYIESLDAVDCVDRWQADHSCFYVDPPYIGHEKYYDEKDTEYVNWKDYKLQSIHFRLAEKLAEAKASCIAVSYYPDPPKKSKMTQEDYNELLDELYPKQKWERFYKDVLAVAAGITKNSGLSNHPKRTELLLIRR